MRRLVPVLPLCACLLGLAACDGSSGLAKAEYDAQISRLCLVAADRFRELHSSTAISTPEHYQAIVRINSDFLKRLAKLKPPAEIAVPAAAYARAMAKFAQDEKTAVAAARAGNDAKLHAAMKRVNGDTGAPYAKAMGATGCY